MRIVSAAIFLLACVASQAGSGASEPAATPVWGVQQLMQEMAQTKSSQRSFTERKYLSVLTAPLDSSGFLVFEAPGRLEKHTLVPQDESLVLSNGIIVIENRARHMKRTMMANQYPAIDAFVESIRATLAGDVNTLMHHYQIKLDGDAAHWHLQLVPNDPAARNLVREIRMAGHGRLMDSIEIIEANGDRSVMKIGAETTAAGKPQ